MYRLAVFNILPGNDFISEKLTDNVIGINTSKIISVSDGGESTIIKIYISPRTKRVITVSQSVATVLSYLGYQSTSRQLTLTRANNSTLLVYTEDIYYAYSKNERTVIAYFDGSRMTSTSLKMTFTEFINEFNEIVISSVAGGGGSVTSVDYASLVNRVSANSGGGSVSSAEHLSIINAISVVSNTLSAGLEYWANALSNSQSAMTSAINVISNGLSNEISNRVSVSAVLDAKISALSALVISGVASVNDRVSALSIAHTSVSDKLTSVADGLNSVNSRATSLADAISIISQKVSTISQNVSVVSNAISNEASVRGATDGVILGCVHAVSNNLSNEISNRVSADNLINSNWAAALSGTVCAMNNGLCAISNNLSNEISIRAVADSALSNAISLVAANLSLASLACDTHADTASAAATSVDGRLTSVRNALSNAISLVAANLSLASLACDTHADTASAAATSVNGRATSLETRISNLSAAHISLVDRVSANSAVGGGGSVTCTELSNAVSNLNSIIANNLSNTNSAIANTNNAISTVSNNLSNEISNRISAIAAIAGGSVTSNEFSALVDSLSSEASNRSAGDAGLSNALSNTSAAVTSVDGRVTSIETRLSGISASHVSLASSLLSVDSHVSLASLACDSHADSASAAATSVNSRATSLANALSVLEVRVSTLEDTPPGSASVTSNELSAVEARVQTLSLVNALSGQVSIDRISVVVLSAVATISASALTGVSGTTIQVSAGGYYWVKGMFAVNNPGPNPNKRYGLTYPAMTEVRGVIRVTGSIAQAGTAVSVKQYTQGFNGAGSESVLLSIISMAATSVMADFEAIMVPSATGNIYFMIGGAAGASAAQIRLGSFIRTEKFR